MYRTGSYSVKSGYKILKKEDRERLLCRTASTSRASLDPGIWNLIWKLPAVPKIKNFIWRVLRNSLPCCSNLARRISNMSSYCPFCPDKIEDVMHCLFSCWHARAAWFTSSLSPYTVVPMLTCFAD